LALINTPDANALYIKQNGDGTALLIQSASSTAETFRLESTGTGKTLIESFTTGQYTGTGYDTAHNFTISNTAATGQNAQFWHTGPGPNVLINSDSNGIPLNIDKDVTNLNNTTTGQTITNTSVVNDAGTYTKTGAALSITSNVTETSGTITDSAIMLDLNQTHADATGAIIDISNAGSGNHITADNFSVTKAGVITGSNLSGTNTGDNASNSSSLPIGGGTLTGATVAADHGTAATAQVVNVCYGTGAAPTASTTPEGTLYVTYTA
jgi:hypothetical protein